jgi:hypothetical protein
VGGLVAVAIFDQKPTAGELLELRLHAGWLPQVSALVSGDVILGHAACLIEKPTNGAGAQP